MRLGSTVMRKTTGALTSFRRISLLEELLVLPLLELLDFTTLLELDFALFELLLDLTEELLDPVALLQDDEEDSTLTLDEEVAELDDVALEELTGISIFLRNSAAYASTTSALKCG